MCSEGSWDCQTNIFLFLFLSLQCCSADPKLKPGLKCLQSQEREGDDSVALKVSKLIRSLLNENVEILHCAMAFFSIFIEHYICV